jgi:ketosteroid isomerase-like protein
MTPQQLADSVARAVDTRDGAAMAALFTEDGVYHDVFYGEFAGRARIAELVNDWIYRAAKDTRWDMFDVVGDGERVYGRYIWSYVSTLPEADGKRVGFEGVCMLKLRGGLITEYREIANTAPALLDIGFPAERVAKIMGRQGIAFKVRADVAAHFAKATKS